MATNVHPLDLAGVAAGSRAERDAAARRLDDALADGGLLALTGHGLGQSRADAVLDAFARFFDLPLAEKRRWRAAPGRRGYDEPVEGVEVFALGRDDAVGPFFDRHRSHFTPNPWPTSVPSLRAAWHQYEDVAAEVVELLLEVMAVALDLPPSWFVDRTQRAEVTTRATLQRSLRTDPWALGDAEPTSGAPEEGLVALVLADPGAGLQLLGAGTWEDVDVASGTLLAGAGDLLATWTGGRWLAPAQRLLTLEAGRRRSLTRVLGAEPAPATDLADGEARPEVVAAGM